MLPASSVTFAASDSYVSQPITFSGQVSSPNLDFVHVIQNKAYVSIPSGCQPGVQNQYPKNATPGEKIVIITTVTSACVGPDVYISQVIVNILPPNSSEVLSTAPASPAINTVTAPVKAGSWTLIVQVLWNGYPTAGNFEIFQTTITINIL
jgi:hypothetical protein